MKRPAIKSCCRIIIQAFLCGLLFIQVIFATYLFIYREVPIPDAWADKLLAKISPKNSTLKAEKLSISASGQVYLTGLQLFADDIENPLIEARLAKIYLSVLKPGQSRFFIRKVVISGGTLHLPSSIAPDGKPSSILERISFSLQFGSDQVQVKSIAALHNQIRLRGDASFPMNLDTRAVPNLSTTPLIERIPYALIRTLITEIDRYDFLSQPTLAFDLKVESETNISLKTKLSSRRIEHPLFQGEDFRLEANLKYHQQSLTAEAPVLLKLKNITYPGESLHAESVSAYIAPENWNDFIQKKWPVFEFAADALEWKTHRLDNPYIRVSSTQLPKLLFQGTASMHQGQFAFDGDLHLKDLSGRIHTRGQFDLLPSLPLSLAKRVPEIRYQTPPYIYGTAQLGPGLVLETADLRLTSEGLELADLTFDHIEADLSFDGSTFQITDSLLQRGPQWVDLSYSIHPETTAYALKLVGSAVPYEYNIILPRWWSVIFRDFEFSESTESLGDFAIYGKANQRVADLFFGHVSATNVRYKNVSIDSGSVIVRGRERYVEIDQMNLQSTAGQVTGKIAFTSRDDGIRQPLSIRYQFNGAILPQQAASIFGGNVAKILTDFEMSKAPTVHLEGVQFSPLYPELFPKSYFSLSASAPHPFLYKKAQLDALELDLTAVRNTTYLRQLRFGFAGGTGTGRADILGATETDTQLNFELSLENAEKEKTFHALSLLSKETTEHHTSEDKYEEKYDLKLHATGPINQPDSFQGNGTLHFRSENLGAIQLLGPLSIILQNTRLGFTSLSLNTMDANFTIEGPVLDFHEIAINGPQTRIFADGTLTFPEKALDMNVRVNLFVNIIEAESGFRKLGELILDPLLRPLPNLLRFNLSGTLEDQNWRSLYDPRNLFK